MRRERALGERTAGRRRGALALLVIALASGAAGFAVAAQSGRSDDRRTARTGPRLVSVVQDGRRLQSARATAVAHWRLALLERWLRQVPRGREIGRGRVTIEVATQRALLTRQVRAAARNGGGEVDVPERPIAARVALGVVKQALRNNCETAALAMVLRAQGVRVDQLALQRALPRSGPADPRRGSGLPVWGDPDRGFVGRPDGGGAIGGYGVYEAPIVALASRKGVRLKSTRHSSAAVYRSLLDGRPVMAWVGLSEGPFMTWRSPAGRRITGNFGEHTVVLTGIAGGNLTVNDPLSGRKLTWSRPYFEQLWKRLGQRALA